MIRIALINLLLTLAVICVGLVSQAQTTSGSPYSSFGLGEIETKGTAFNAGMGDVKYALLNRSLVNVANPASYARLIDRRKHKFNPIEYPNGDFRNVVEISQKIYANSVKIWYILQK